MIRGRLRPDGRGVKRASQTTPLLWSEERAPEIRRVASVVPVQPIDTVYAFEVPEALADQIAPGQRVRIPIGRHNRRVDGFVLDVSERSWTTTLKPIDSLLDRHSYLNAELLELGRWMARYYGTPLGRTLAAMVPAPVRDQSGFRSVRWLRLALPLGHIVQTATRLGPAQRAVLEALAAAPAAVPADTLGRDLGVSSATVRGLIRKGWITQQVEKQARPAPNCDEPPQEPGFSLNDEQQRACAEIAALIDRRCWGVRLLYGVSGSGKTEVYINAMRRVLDRGRQVIVLIPEIALTTQLVRRFAVRFRNVAVIHSGLTGVKRSLTWEAIRRGDKRVIIGTRSAVFAPCPDLGLVVIDEEQEPSYKNMQAPRFHARETAMARARLQNIPIVLGSATPALETWQGCSDPDGRRIHLTRRVAELQMPQVAIVDMRAEPHRRPGMHLLSRLLEQRLAEVLQRREQAVLLLNRRGYAQVLYCPRCKLGVSCRNCQAGMVFHRISGTVVCHHCYVQMEAPRRCADPSCGTPLIRFGLGTERAEEEVQRKFPQARLRRIDSDTMGRTADYEDMVRAFENHEYDFMIGTQMVAKGLDFPRVSLVGVLNADTALHLPDFRADERTFQLVTQVAGRAGRAHGRGQVVVQTAMPELPALLAAAQHDYDRFAATELAARRKTGMPPFSVLVRWVLSDAAESTLKLAAAHLAGVIREACVHLGLSDARVSGPFPCPLERLRRRYRQDILLRTATAEQRSALLDYLRQEHRLRSTAERVIVDVDPVSLL